MKPPILIKIDHTTELRLLDERDAAPIYRLINANRSYLRAWLPWIDYTQSVEDERTFIRNVRIQYQNNHSFTCAIWHEGQITGTIGFHPFDWGNRKVEIGYWLGAQFQGKGLMTRACRAMIVYAFDELQLKKVEIRCATGNTASCAIPQRLGFTHEGTIRQAEWLYNYYVDLKLYGLLESEWRQQNQAERFKLKQE
jgi:ribosomal-protein-serine acetyltransferase